MPFYAGWGLTEDLQICKRRKRSLTIDQLAAGALLLYPRYVHPSTKELCEIELVLAEILKEQERIAHSAFCRQLREMRNRAISISRKLFVKTKKTNVH
jgi:capsular polysaccharide export protein